jgi:hypothetical protein
VATKELYHLHALSHAADEILTSWPPITLGPGDLNLSALYKPPTNAPSFSYNPRKMSQKDAEAFCQSQGGHLAAYISKVEQNLVEQTFMNRVGS